MACKNWQKEAAQIFATSKTTHKTNFRGVEGKVVCDFGKLFILQEKIVPFLLYLHYYFEITVDYANVVCREYQVLNQFVHTFLYNFTEKINSDSAPKN